MTAPAITYTVDGEQYIAIAAAFGGSGGLGATGDPNTDGAAEDRDIADLPPVTLKQMLVSAAKEDLAFND